VIKVRRILSLSATLAAAAAAAAAAVTGGGAAALAGAGPAYPPGFTPKNAAAAERIRLQNQAIDLINAADRHIYATVPGCKPKAPSSHTTTTHDAPSQPVLDALAPLRRPATAAEQQGDLRPHVGFGGETYIDYVRQVTTAGGHPFTIVIGRSIPAPFGIPSRCYDAVHARLLHLLKGRPRKLKSVTLEEFSHLRAGQEKNNAQPTTPVDGIYLFDGGGGGGGADVASFKERGVFTSMGGGRGVDEQSRLNGLVPDGVASITFEYPKSVSRGPNYKPTVYRSAVTKTVSVQNNVVSVEVPRPAPDAFPHRMVWRDAAGNVVHTFTEGQDS
jgi:hypothetical protein